MPFDAPAHASTDSHAQSRADPIQRHRRLLVEDTGSVLDIGYSPPGSLARHRRHSISRPWRPSGHPSKRSKSGSPMSNRISIGSTAPGIPQNLSKTGSTILRYGKHQKSNWTTIGLWFSNPAESGALGSCLLPSPKNRCKNNLAPAV